MSKKLTKRLLGVVLSVALVFGQAIPALAEGEQPDLGGTGNVLDYAVTTVVTPTSLKIALNPNEYAITTKYVKTADESYQSTKTYFTEADGVYTAADITAFAANTVYYEAVKSTAQVVSLNYGIANKSTEAKDVTVDIKATYTAAADKTAIEFVDTAAKTQAYNAETNATGAKKDELKMYLAVASAATPSGDTVPVTADTFVKATAFAANTKYFTKSEAGVFAEASTQPTADTFKNATYYTATTTIGPEITAAQLSDVTMTAATGDSVRVFAPGAADAAYKAATAISYKLGEATYSVKAGEIIDFSTTQAQLVNKLEMSALGGVAAFTITGAINKNADWTKADATAIKFTPVYTVVAATDTETAVTGGYNQVTLQSLNNVDGVVVVADGVFYVGASSTEGLSDVEESDIVSVTVNGKSLTAEQIDVQSNATGTWIGIPADSIVAVEEDNEWASDTEWTFVVTTGTDKYTATYTMP